MALRVYNTLTKQKELFEPLEPGKVRMYLCGPTVYKSPHIGHMVGPVIFDAIKRYLRFKGFAVRWVINITDVDDKLIARAAELKTTMPALAEKCTKEYFDCLAAFGIDTVDHFPRASEHMPEIIEMCSALIAKGTAYAAGGSVWFDVAKDPDYGKLSHRSLEEQEAGTRDLEGTGKRSRADFALWKAAKPGEPSWDSPWGPGRPGWHIECSAMSRKHLGITLDIHGGGMDLLFPHHENELAQVGKRKWRNVCQILAAQRAYPRQYQEDQRQRRRNRRRRCPARDARRSESARTARPGIASISAAEHTLSPADRVQRGSDRLLQEGFVRFLTTGGANRPASPGKGRCEGHR